MIRNGFVSNSSSSSFILSYSNNNRIVGAANIVKYLKEFPKEEVLFYGGNQYYYEGEPLLELDNDKKILIRKYSEEFIQREPKDSPYELYTGGIAKREEDLDTKKTLLEPFRYNLYLEAVKDNNKEYPFEEYMEDKAASIEKLEEDRKARFVFIDYSVQFNYGAQEFFDDFITTEDPDNRFLVCYRGYEDFDTERKPPYMLCYKKRLKDKSSIISYIRDHKENLRAGLCWLSESYEFVTSHQSDIEMFVLGEKEIDYLLNHEEDFLEKKLNVSLFVNYRVFKDSLFINNEDVGKEIIVREGRFKEITDCLPDFEEIFFEN